MATEQTHEQPEQAKYVERDTGMSNRLYNLVSVLYHALQSAQTCACYIQDAEQAGKSELASFFRDVQQENNKQAERARRLLTQLGTA